MKIGAWNVRTLLDRETPDCDRPPRRTALVASELKRYDVDIAALSETRFAGEDSLTEVGEGYTFFWRGLQENEPRRHGVGFAIKSSLLRVLPENPVGISERLMTLRLPLVKNRHCTLLSVYAPTLTSEEEIIESFYDQLSNTIRNVPRQDKLILLGDFNARVGTLHEIYEGIIGKHGVGKVNANGLRLLNLCATFELCITNTFFQLKNMHKTTWMHPRSKHWHQIDFTICRRNDLQDFNITKVMRGAECWTDHRLLRSLVKFRIRPPARKQKKKKTINISKFHDPTTLEQLHVSTRNTIANLDIPDDPANVQLNDISELDNIWKSLADSLYETVTETIGFTQRKTEDWFDQNDERIKELLQKKNKLHQKAIDNPSSPSARSAFQEHRRECQRLIRRMKNEWWERKANEIQNHANTNNQQGFYSAIKSAYGPVKNSFAPLQSEDGQVLHKDSNAILGRWTEYLSTLLNHQNPCNDAFIGELPIRPPIPELEDPPTYEEITKACQALKNGKAAGPDGLPAEVYKYADPSVIKALHTIILLCWTTEHIPQTWKDPIISMLYKKKGSKILCQNYRGFSLLDVAGKILARVMLTRLIRSPIMEILPETQSGFRKDRCTSDMIFIARQLQEKSREQRQNLYLTFVDLAKAFDTVNRDLLWKVLARFGCPPKFLTMIRIFHDGMSARVSVGGTLSEAFEVTVGVKQGCVLAPVIFNIYMAAITLVATKNLDYRHGVSIRYRLDGNLFNLRRLKAHTKTTVTTIHDMQYADDAGYPSNRPRPAQHKLNVVSDAYSDGGLAVNTDKTVSMAQENTPDDVNNHQFTVNDTVIKEVPFEKYLGTILSSDCSLDLEIQNRMRLASASIGKLDDRVFQNNDLSIATKIKVYLAITISILLYGSEAWTLYRYQIRRLETFHIRFLQGILGLTWRDKVPYTTILERTNVTSIEAMLISRQFRWVGHVIRMSPDRLPRCILYGELVEGTRTVGAPKKRYKDHLKANLKACDILPSQLEALASNRSGWRSECHRGLALFEARRTEARNERRAARHAREQRAAQGLVVGVPCPVCNKLCASEFGLRSHLRVLRPRNNNVQD